MLFLKGWSYFWLKNFDTEIEFPKNKTKKLKTFGCVCCRLIDLSAKLQPKILNCICLQHWYRYRSLERTGWHGFSTSRNLFVSVDNVGSDRRLSLNYDPKCSQSSPIPTPAGISSGVNTLHIDWMNYAVVDRYRSVGTDQWKDIIEFAQNLLRYLSYI